MKEGPALVLFVFKIPLPYPITVTIIGAALLGLGIGISNEFGLMKSFLGFPLIWFSISSFVWGYGVLCWATKTYEPILRGLYKYFKVEETTFNKLVDDYLQKEVYNDRSWIKYYVLIGSIVTAGVIYFLYEVLLVIPDVKLIFSNPILLAYFIGLEFLVSILAAVGVYLVIIHSRFVRRISNFKINLDPLESPGKPPWHSLTRFSLHSSITWFIAIALLTLLFLGPGSQLIFVAIPFIIISIITFLKPQLVLHCAIKKAKNQLLDKIRENLEHSNNDDIKVIRYMKEFERAERIQEWPFTTGTMTQLLISTVIPFTPWIIDNLVRRA